MSSSGWTSPFRSLGPRLLSLGLLLFFGLAAGARDSVHPARIGSGRWS
jgi:hypothetical protein